MDENNRAQSTPSSNQQHEKRARVPYQRTVPHITQDPITDDGVTYQQRIQRETYSRTGSRAAAGAGTGGAARQDMRGYRPQAPGDYVGGFAGGPQQQSFTSAPGRKHMGVATSDPQYSPRSGSSAPQDARRRGAASASFGPLSLGALGSQDDLHSTARPRSQAGAYPARARAHRRHRRSRVDHLLPLDRNTRNFIPRFDAQNESAHQRSLRTTCIYMYY